MQVKAAAGLRVPKLGEPRKYIDDSRVVEVIGHPYYRRLIAAGDLLEVRPDTPADATAPAEPAAPEKPAKKGGK